MFTWKIWRGLNDPPHQHPLFVRTVTVKPIIALKLNLLLLVWVAGALAMVFICPTLAFSLPVGLLGLPFLPVLLVGTLYGGMWAVNVSSAIGTERERSTYDLLCVSPTGALAVHWTLWAACLHRRQAFTQVCSQIRSLLVMVYGVLAFLGAICVMIVIGGGTPSLRDNAFNSLLSTITAAVAVGTFYVDYMQSIVISGIVGMAAVNYSRSSSEARLGSFAVYLLLQGAVYMLFFLIGFGVLPTLFSVFSAEAELALWLLRFALLCGMREVLIVYLWRILYEHLGVSTSEMVSIGGLRA